MVNSKRFFFPLVSLLGVGKDWGLLAWRPGHWSTCRSLLLVAASLRAELVLA